MDGAGGKHANVQAELRHSHSLLLIFTMIRSPHLCLSTVCNGVCKSNPFYFFCHTKKQRSGLLFAACYCLHFQLDIGETLDKLKSACHLSSNVLEGMWVTNRGNKSFCPFQKPQAAIPWIDASFLNYIY